MVALETLAAILLGLGLPLVAIALRRQLLQRTGGTIDLSLRLRTLTHGRGWVLGAGRFAGDDLQWYRVFSLALRPRRTLSRRDLVVVRQRQPVGGETLALLEGVVVLECLTCDGRVEVALDGAAVTGFLAWLEAAPPGATLPR